VTKKPSYIAQAQIQHVHFQGGTAVSAWYHPATEQQLGAAGSAGYIIPYTLLGFLLQFIFIP